MNSKSFYKRTESDDFFLGYWGEISLPYDSSDVYIVISTEYHLKPGKLANDLYGDPQLLWVFSAYNRDNLLDPLNDFVEGKIIRIPTKSRILSLI